MALTIRVIILLVARNIRKDSKCFARMKWGCRSVFLAEVLAKGEVPRDARSIWKQRSRWASAAHMYILDPSSVFWRQQRNMSYWQKSLYWIPMVLHWTLLWAEPIMFSMPIICLWGVALLHTAAFHCMGTNWACWPSIRFTSVLGNTMDLTVNTLPSHNCKVERVCHTLTGSWIVFTACADIVQATSVHMELTPCSGLHTS